jgi:hypothetical protein
MQRAVNERFTPNDVIKLSTSYVFCATFDKMTGRRLWLLLLVLVVVVVSVAVPCDGARVASPQQEEQEEALNGGGGAAHHHQQQQQHRELLADRRQRPKAKGRWERQRHHAPRAHEHAAAADERVMHDTFGWGMPAKAGKGGTVGTGGEAVGESPGGGEGEGVAVGVKIISSKGTTVTTATSPPPPTDDAPHPDAPPSPPPPMPHLPPEVFYTNHTRYPQPDDVSEPKFLLYMFGHLRSFHLLSRRHLQQWVRGLFLVTWT